MTDILPSSTTAASASTTAPLPPIATEDLKMGDSNGNGAAAAHAAAAPPPATNLTIVAAKQRGLNPERQPSSMQQEHKALKIVFKSLSWIVDVKNNDEATKKTKPIIKKKVLDNVSGVLRPGKFTAVMGSSGAGKTTLLNVIAGYGYGGETQGEILVNGEPIGTEFMRELSAFVHQQDIILETMTVREAVRMAAYLRLPKHMTSIEKDARIDEVLRWLNLVKVQDNMIGSPEKKGISGGERRRVSVAMEMVRNPGILFLDEPTSGLDTFTAYSVAHLLQSVAHQHNRTIVATIHQPSSEIFALFDDLLLLDAGRVIYHGPAAQAMRYFDVNLGYKIPRYTNPSDFIFMRILNGGGKKEMIGTRALRSPVTVANANGSNSASPALTNGHDNGNGQAEHEAKWQEVTKPHENGNGHANGNGNEFDSVSSPKSPTAEEVKEYETQREQRIIDMWNKPNKKTNEFTEDYMRIQEEINSQTLGMTLPDRKNMATNVASFFTQYYFLAMRSINDVVRNPYKLRARLGQALFMGIFNGLCYLQVGHGQNSVHNRSGVLFFLCASGTMNAAMGTLTIFLPEKEVFKREYASKMYSLPAFFFSKFAMELPLRIFMPFIMALIVYWMVGLQNTAEHFFIFTGTLIMIDMVGSSLGTLFATIFPSLPVALAASPMMLLPLMLFGGFFLNASHIPDYFNWISYISPIKWAFQALARNEFPGLTFTCDPGEVCPIQTGDDALTQLAFGSETTLKSNEGILVGLAVGFFALAYIALWRTSKKL